MAEAAKAVKSMEIEEVISGNEPYIATPPVHDKF